jgi:hypothetical protein
VLADTGSGLDEAGIGVLFEPLGDEDLGLTCYADPLSVEQLPTERTVEALVISILPGGTGIDSDGFDAHLGQPVSEGL